MEEPSSRQPGSNVRHRRTQQSANVFIADEQARPIDTGRLENLAGFVLADQQIPSTLELYVRCVKAEPMASLNQTHMGKAGPTDVLAFPIDLPDDLADGEPGILGDVVLCPEVAASQAAAHGKTIDQELDLLLVHGILHLLGHDHAEPDEKKVMFDLTGELLDGFQEFPSAQGGPQ